MQIEIADEIASVVFFALATEFLQGDCFRVNGFVNKVKASIEINSEVI